MNEREKSCACVLRMRYDDFIIKCSDTGGRLWPQGILTWVTFDSDLFLVYSNTLLVTNIS